MIKGVIFDLDDTLYNATECYQYGMNSLSEYVYEEFDIQKEDFIDKFAAAKKDVKTQLGDVAASHNRLLYIQRFLEMIGKSPFQYALKMYEIYWNSAFKDMSLYEYVIPLFRMLKGQKRKIIILSDLTAHIQYRKIERLAIRDYIDFLITSEEVGKEKPSGESFDAVKKKTGLTENELLMVGDSYEKDIIGARKAGIRAIQYKPDVNIIQEVRISI